jgi:anti-sigma B factor antagonist
MGSAMSVYRHLEVRNVGNALAVRFHDREIRDDAVIEEIGKELFGLIESEKGANVVLNFQNVSFLSSAALVKLIAAYKLIKSRGGGLKLCSIRPEFKEVFSITHLDRLFEILPDEAAALEAFEAAV